MSKIIIISNFQLNKYFSSKKQIISLKLKPIFQYYYLVFSLPLYFLAKTIKQNQHIS